MRKPASIMLALLFLVSGMHPTLAIHFCKGNAVAVKVSLSGIKAGCGMESAAAKVPAPGTLIRIHCCHDDLQVFKTDRYFAYAGSDYKVLPHHSVPAVFSPEHPITGSKLIGSCGVADPGPPGYFSANTVSIASICIFRI